MSHPMLRSSLTAVVFLALAASAQGGTLYVASNGVDGPTCGPKKSPCRSISQAVNTNAADGDTIIVGPGSYGDLNRDGTLGDSPGEESGGLGCVLLVARAVTITSSDGAAATIIDGRTVSASCNVGLVVDGTQFGKPGKGFTVTNTHASAVVSDGIVVASTNVAVRGNQVVAIPDPGHADLAGAGINAVSAPQTILIEANQVIGWGIGIATAGTGQTVRGNRVSLCQEGIMASSDLLGNVITGNDIGINGARAGSSVVGNALVGNGTGIFGGGGLIMKNNFLGSLECGLENRSGTAIVAASNYWGAATGPGAAPADRACDGPGGGSTTVTPFATKPFKVKAPFKP